MPAKPTNTVKATVKCPCCSQTFTLNIEMQWEDTVKPRVLGITPQDMADLRNLRLTAESAHNVGP